MSYIIAVTKLGYDVINETDPNSFVFHSDYNTFKIIRSGVLECALVGTTNGQLFYQPHLLNFTPLVTAFAKQTGYSQVFPPNSINISTWGAKAGIISTGVKFVSVAADGANIIFKFDKTNAGDTTVKVRYYCLETI